MKPVAEAALLKAKKIKKINRPALIQAGLVLVLALLAFVPHAWAQNDIPIGSWRNHLAYNNGQMVVNAGSRVYCVTSSGLFFFDRTDNTTVTISKIDGLTGVAISAIGFDPNSNTLVIGYADGNLDFVQDNVIDNYSLIAQSPFSGSKRINHVVFRNGLAYISTDFGVVVYDLQLRDVRETFTDLGVAGADLAINQAVFRGDSLFLATELGVIAALADGSVNLLDFRSWRRFGQEQGIEVRNIPFIVIVNNQVVAGIANSSQVLLYNGNNWQTYYTDNTIFRAMNSNGSTLLLTFPDRLVQVTGPQQGTEVTDALFANLLGADIASDGSLWVADDAQGLLSNFGGAFQQYIPTGPASNSNNSLLGTTSQLISVSGILPGNAGISGGSGFYTFTTTGWQSFIPAATPTDGQPPLVADVVAAAANPTTGTVAFATWGSGVLLWDGQGAYTLIDHTTPGSTLVNLDPQGTLVRITDVAYDNNGTLWMLNDGTSLSLHALTANGEWNAYSLGAASAQARQLLIADNGDLWIALRGGNILVFDAQENRQRTLTTAEGQGELPNNTVNAMALDLVGQVWVGTNAGIAFYATPFLVLENSRIDANRPIFEDQFLLRDEEITAIAIDQGNRKWVGTTNGLWLFDDFGERLVFRFTEANSPLLSDQIIDIAINDNNGEVFIATASGLLSFRGTATSAEAVHQNVRIFPNPVTQNFNGQVGISGLARDANVKITDASGKLVFETQAEGGTATWNVRDFSGMRPTTGVYLVFSASADGQETYVGKIAIVN